MCVVKLFVGLPCPGCGLLHALGAALAGHWEAAFLFFPIWPLFLAAVIFRRRPVVPKLFLSALFLQWFVRLW